MQRLWQSLCHVASLMNLATLDRCVGTEGPTNDLAQRLSAVDDEQPADLWVEPAFAPHLFTMAQPVKDPQTEAYLPSLDQLRNNAAECIRLAEAARTSAHKSFFIEMADRWLTLAERAAKTQDR